MRRLSIIDESGERYVRMAHLAALGSHAINGVAALHTELLKTHVLRDFYELTPEKFTNKTNGVTPRRWMVLTNPRLAHLLTARLGHSWIHDLEKLRKLEPFARRSRIPPASGAPSSTTTSSVLPPTSTRLWASPSIPTPCSMCWSSACTSTSAST